MTTDNRTNVQIVADALRSMPEAERDDDRDPAVVVAEYAVAALVAAQGATTEELAKIKPLFENLSREYPNECNKRVKAEAERDAALEAIERVRETLMLHNPNGRLVKEVLAALDGAPEPEDEPEEEMYQAGCGSWDCRAPECGKA